MPKYTLTKKNATYLTLEIDGREYNIPLVTSMKIKEARKLLKIIKMNESQLDEMVDELTEFLGKYMGEEIVEEMTFVDMIEVFNLWKSANEQVEGLSMGESSASSSS